MVKRYIKIVIACALMFWLSAAAPDLKTEASSSFADYLHFSRSKYPGDYGWLPDLTGLPNEAKVFDLTNHVINVMLKEKEETCLSINFHLRKMVFQHFVVYQHMANAQNVFF